MTNSPDTYYRTGDGHDTEFVLFLADNATECVDCQVMPAWLWKHYRGEADHFARAAKESLEIDTPGGKRLAAWEHQNARACEGFINFALAEPGAYGDDPEDAWRAAQELLDEAREGAAA